MNMSGKGGGLAKTTLKSTSLNPNAVEFVPSALKSPSIIINQNESSKATLGKAVLDRSESSVSNNSDDEAHNYWRRQLPDDITPDFNIISEEDSSQGINNLSLSGLSLTDLNETSRFSPSMGSGFMLKSQHELSSPHLVRGNSLRYPIGYGEEQMGATFQGTKPWDKHIMNNEGSQFNGNPIHGYVPDMLTEQTYLDNPEINPIEILASQFPGFAAECLTELYFANEGDFHLTVDMLTQLELQIDGDFNQNLSSKALSAPNLSALDFPALSGSDGQNGMHNYGNEEMQHNIHSRGDIDFVAAVRKMAPQNSGMWKYDRNGSSDASVGSSRSSHILASSYSSGQGNNNNNSNKGMLSDRVLQTRGSNRAAPIWLETGEAVANMYTEMREEARDHARLRNAYFDQARQAYLIGNKALAKELSVKGQVHNMEMKAAHGKAQESIYRQRNPVSPNMQGNGRGHERIIDLHGLHVSEAIHVLKRELGALRNAARSADQRLQVYICVGTGHHTRGSRTPVRLPVAVQRYLLEEEGLTYTEPQPGLLRVVIF